MMASTASATAAAAAFGAAAAAKPRGCARVPAAGGRRRSGVVRCDAGVEAQAVAKAASIAALEQFKISADRESLALASNPSPSVRFL
jgi:glutamyl-tRNA reductase